MAALRHHRTYRKIQSVMTALLILMGLPAYGQSLSWSRQTIDSSISCPSGLCIVDLDSDGDMDVCAASWFDNSIVWYKQGQDGTWQKHLISDKMPYAVGVDAADIDGDKDIDVVAASNAGNEVQWYEYDSDAGTWRSFTVDRSLKEANWVKIADVDGDGDKDIIADGHGEAAVVWYENTRPIPVVPISWTRRIIDGSNPGPLQLIVKDMNGDGRPDVIAASDTAQDIRIYLNLGGSPVTWKQVTIDHFLQGVVSIASGDLDGDSDIDIAAVGYSEDAVVWYENVGGDCTAWQRHFVAPIGQPRHVHIADINLDGRPDVLATSYTGHLLYWYDRVDDDTWNAEEISRNLEYNRVFYTGDMNNDGRPDNVVNVQGSGTVIVLYNQEVSSVRPSPEDAEQVCLLGQNSPNPFNTDTFIPFQLLRSASTSVVIRDLLGRMVATPLLETTMESGSYRLRFEAGNLPCGIYSCHLMADCDLQSVTMLLLR